MFPLPSQSPSSLDPKAHTLSSQSDFLVPSIHHFYHIPDLCKSQSIIISADNKLALCYHSNRHSTTLLYYDYQYLNLIYKLIIIFSTFPTFSSVHILWLKLLSRMVSRASYKFSEFLSADFWAVAFR